MRSVGGGVKKKTEVDLEEKRSEVDLKETVLAIANPFFKCCWAGPWMKWSPWHCLYSRATKNQLMHKMSA